LLSSCDDYLKLQSGGNSLKLKTMTLKKNTSWVYIALVVSICAGCSSKEDRDKYDHYYGSGSKSREETALVELQNERRTQAEKPAAPAVASATTTAADSGKAGDSTATTTAAGTAAAPAETAAALAVAPKRKPIPADVSALLNKHICLACHQPYDKIIGPPYADVAKKKYTVDQIVELVHNPKPEHWPGFPPMAPMPQVPKADIVVIANWINSL
jgi:cytochrome c551/c552